MERTAAHCRVVITAASILRVLAWAFPAGDVSAQQPVAAVSDPAVLRVGTAGDYPPFTYRDPATGQYIGADLEQAENLAAALHRRLLVVPTPWRSLLADLAAGRFDIAMGGISITPDRAGQGSFSRPYLHDGKTPLARCADQARYTTLARIDRPDVRVIENPGGTNERFAKAHLAHAQLRVHTDNLSVFDEILSGRADLMITDAIEARLQQQLRPGLCAVHPDQPFDHSEKAYLMPRESALRADVDRWLQASLSSGRGQALLDRWLHYPWPTPPAPAVALARLIDERLSLMPDVARYKWNHKQAIEDLPRERALIDSVRGQAAVRGLSPERVAVFFSAQIEASKVVQRELFARWESQGQGAFDSVRDLGADIRPRLDALNPQLLDTLKAVEGPVTREVLGTMPASAISPAAVDVALAPLLRH
jgi:chorismate mutase-like protein